MCILAIPSKVTVIVVPVNGMFIQELQADRIPPPSQITWQEVPRILSGVIPSPTDLSNIGEIPAIEAVKTVRAKIGCLVRNVTEMEATVRVLMYVIEASWDIADVQIQIQMQPSVTKHSTFTDFLFVVKIRRDEKVMGFIEIKKISVSTDLTTTTKVTAQAIREAHILTLEKECQSVPFAITNSSMWSFGLAKKANTRVEIVKIYTQLSSLEKQQRQVVTILKSIIQGQWPAEPNPEDLATS